MGFLQKCGQLNLHGICDVPANETLFDNQCFDFTESQLQAYTSFDLTFSVAPQLDLKLKYQNYLLQDFGVNGKKGQYCLAIAATGRQGLMIVGDTLMKDYLVVFDQTNKQIGWADVSTSCGNLEH